MSAEGPPRGANSAPAGGSEAREPAGPSQGRTRECEARTRFTGPQAWGDHSSAARPLLALCAALLAATTLLSGCAPVLVGAAIGGTALVVADRRSVGAQADDEAIELKISNNIGTGYGDKVHVNATSYNGIVLLSGEVPTQDLVATIGEIARTTPKVRRVDNELTVGPVASFGSRSNDSYITSKVKSRFVEANKFAANHVKVVTERQVVYLMGLVRHDEGDAAAQIAATTSGVVRVVKLFEYIG